MVQSFISGVLWSRCNQTWFSVFMKCLLKAGCLVTVMENRTSFCTLLTDSPFEWPWTDIFQSPYVEMLGKRTQKTHPVPTHGICIKVISVQAKLDFWIELLCLTWLSTKKHLEACGHVMPKKKKKEFYALQLYNTCKWILIYNSSIKTL